MDYDAGSAEHIKTPASNSAAKRWLILATVTVATGLAAGLGGMVLGLLLHFVQHVAYGYSLHTIARMTAHSAMFFQFEGGKICSQRNHDCFEPW